VPNGEWASFEDAVKRSRRFPNCSFGVHLNLTSFAPLSSAKNLDPVLRAGKFYRELLSQSYPANCGTLWSKN
jgi:predicted glycoside hydrolase/deacetylase ChbG (UPF0249 family)